jgi:hypothetical protein
LELWAYFAALRSRLPSNEDDSLEIREADLPELCPGLESAGTWWLHIVKSHHDAPVETVHLHADRESANALDCCSSRLLRPFPERLSVHLTTKPSGLEELVVFSPAPMGCHGVQTSVQSVTYEPGERVRFPLCARAYSFAWPSIVLPSPGHSEILPSAQPGIDQLDARVLAEGL